METSPPFELTPLCTHLLVEIGQLMGSTEARLSTQTTPQLRRQNQIRTVQASLQIENNTLTLQQVTDLIEGKRVLGKPREIREVKNAYAAYDLMEQWKPYALKDLHHAHRVLMEGLVDEHGKFRRGSVGIYAGKKLIHVAPPAVQVHPLMKDLLAWLQKSTLHPLVTSSIFHFEFELIHPFADGNGRLGRLWQTLILSQWNPIWAYLSVESMVRDHQKEYYAALQKGDQAGSATPFVEFMLDMFAKVLREISHSPAGVESGAESGVESTLLALLGAGSLSKAEIARAMGKSRPNRYLHEKITELLKLGILEQTIPEKPNSRLQKYRLAQKK